MRIDWWQRAEVAIAVDALNRRLNLMGRPPRAGEAVEVQGWRFEVVDLDGRRIATVLAAPVRTDAVRVARPGAGPDPQAEVTSSYPWR